MNKTKVRQDVNDSQWQARPELKSAGERLSGLR